jgi:hypothetical protein
MASVTIGDAADIITSTVHKAVDPLERRVAELEGKVATLQTRVLAAVRVRGTVAT